MKMKLGRLPRGNNPNIMKLSAFGAIPAAPATADWTKGIKQFGMMMNDTLGCCTCAAVYHARQIWTANTAKESTEPDGDVLKLYEAACGYDPNDPSTDGGGVEQSVLGYLYNTGIPLADGSVDKILGFVEVNEKNFNEVKLTIAEFGVAYIGIAVPSSIYDAGGNVQSVWDYVPGAQIEGGHAVACVGYDATNIEFISWGAVYKMTWAFFAQYCEEVYAIVDKNWIASTGKTPMGMDLSDLEKLMSKIKE
jgi:hypothetical protein